MLDRHVSALRARAALAMGFVGALGCAGGAGSHFAMTGRSASDADVATFMGDDAGGAGDDAPTGAALDASLDDVGDGEGDAGSSVSDGGASEAASLPPMKSQAFLIGYNEAWFGSKFGTDLTSDFDLGYVQKVFDGVASSGGHLVRLWLWEAPQGITLGAAAPQTEALSPAFVANLDAVIAEARKRGLWIYVTLLDANTIAKDSGTLHTYGVDLLNDTGGETEAFNANAVAPVLAMLEAHRDNLFGIDVINEIEAAQQNGVFADATNGARAFIAREAAFIKSKAPWVRVTASAGWPSDLLRTGAQYDIANGLFSGLGLDFYDVHAYADSGSFSGATDMCNRAASDGLPVYLGEFGQSTHALDDTLQYKATGYFLNNARSLCLKGAFAWRYDAAESWWGFVRPDFSPRPAVAIMQTFGGLP